MGNSQSGTITLSFTDQAPITIEKSHLTYGRVLERLQGLFPQPIAQISYQQTDGIEKIIISNATVEEYFAKDPRPPLKLQFHADPTPAPVGMPPSPRDDELDLGVPAIRSDPGDKIFAPEIHLGDPSLPETRRLRIVCISDTHGQQPDASRLPPGDILVHTGDWCKGKEIGSFPEWFTRLPYAHKLIICGNHEVSLPLRGRPADVEAAVFHNGCHLLYDSGIRIEGVFFWGLAEPSTIPDQPAPDRDVSAAAVPADVDVLLSHLPPWNVLDRAWVKIDVHKGICPYCHQHSKKARDHITAQGAGAPVLFFFMTWASANFSPADFFQFFERFEMFASRRFRVQLLKLPPIETRAETRVGPVIASINATCSWPPIFISTAHTHSHYFFFAVPEFSRAAQLL
ncbi:putative ser/Thr protein phosphatase family protein [Paratrimastix pyriformis]|uniref:Ser/Thr protein phosphatase family protein n=1 Tax=Paratrimastix pyriformis TaxID=342808 RepID=A0ABQ8U876_9EUKA|nr:putative ser/Thr protein phosphatase family protein [Paratrimastix pyriformis]